MQLKFAIMWIPALAVLSCCSLRASSSTISVKMLETILHSVHSAELKDVVNRQFLYTLFNNRNNRLQFVNLDEAVPKQLLFVTVVPCTSPMEVEFIAQQIGAHSEAKMKPTAINDDVLSTNKANSPGWEPTNYISSRAVTYKLDTGHLHSIALRMKLFEQDRSSPAERANVKAILRISNRYPDIELGANRYNVLVCSPDPVNQPDMLSVRFNRILNVPANLGDYLVCLVVNRVRPLREFCAAQVALGNQLPFAEDSLLNGGSLEKLTLRAGDFAYECKPHGSEIPVVNIVKLLDSNPSVLFANLFLVKPPKESGAQPEAISWETVRYYRRDPHYERILAPVHCESSVPAGQGRAPLIEVSPGKFRAKLVIQLPPEASLLVRPSRLDLVGSAYNVQLAPLSGQSNSFERLAQLRELSCSDSVWGYGGVICGKYQIHSCLPGDEEACRFDRVRLSIGLDHKYQSSDQQTDHNQTRFSYGKATKLLAEPREVHWQIVLPPTRDEPTVLQPKIGRVAEAEEVLTNITHLALARSGGGGQVPNSSEMLKTVRDCQVALKDGLVGGTSEALIGRAANCYRWLLEICTHVHIQCKKPDHPLTIDIATPVFVPAFSPSDNVYICLVFEAELKQTREPSNRKELDATEQWLRTRLLQSVSTIDLPTMENQGFGRGDNSEANTDESGGRKIISFKRVYRYWTSDNRNPSFVPKINEKWLWLRYYAIYIYAAPPNTRYMRQQPSLASLRVVTYNTTLAQECRHGTKVPVERIVDL